MTNALTNLLGFAIVCCISTLVVAQDRTPSKANKINSQRNDLGLRTLNKVAKLGNFDAQSPPKDHPRVARQLVHALDWGVLSTTSKHLEGLPFGNAVSYSDGAVGNSTGRLLFYLTVMDFTAQDIETHPNATLTICAAQQPKGCEGTDPEDPTCAKLSITGHIAPVPVDSEAWHEAREMLFARHPAMADWPQDHGFKIYELYPKFMMLLDWYGGAKMITPKEYFAVDLKKDNVVITNAALSVV